MKEYCTWYTVWLLGASNFFNTSETLRAVARSTLNWVGWFQCHAFSVGEDCFLQPRRQRFVKFLFNAEDKFKVSTPPLATKKGASVTYTSQIYDRHSCIAPAKKQDTFCWLAYASELLPTVQDLFGSFNMDDTCLTSNSTHVMIQDESKQKQSTDEGCIVTDLCVSSPKESLRKNQQGKRAGRWSPEEKLLFLHGLKQFGRGRWKKIQTFLPTR